MGPLDNLYELIMKMCFIQKVRIHISSEPNLKSLINVPSLSNCVGISTVYEDDTGSSIEYLVLKKKLRTSQDVIVRFNPPLQLNVQLHNAMEKYAYTASSVPTTAICPYSSTESIPNEHYFINVENYTRIDFYALMRLYGITDPCVQHSIKKLLALGKRNGGKSSEQDIQEVISQLTRKLQLDKMDKPNG